MKERPESQQAASKARLQFGWQLWSWVGEHPGFSATVAIVALDALLFLAYTQQLGHFPPVGELDFAQGVMVLVAGAVVSGFVLAALLVPAGIACLAAPPRGMPGDDPARREVPRWWSPLVSRLLPCVESDAQKREMFWWLPAVGVAVAIPLCVMLGAFAGGQSLLATFAALAVIGGVLTVWWRGWTESRLGRPEAERLSASPCGKHGKLARAVYGFGRVIGHVIVWGVGLLAYGRALALAGLSAGAAGIAVLGVISAFLSFAAVRALYKWRVTSDREEGAATALSEVARAVLILLVGAFFVLFLITAFGPGPWRLLGIGRYDASCSLDAAGVRVLHTLRPKDEVRDYCREGHDGLWRCELHVWWGIGEEWLVSLGQVPLWLRLPEERSGSIVPLPRRYIRGCVPLDAGARVPAARRYEGAPGGRSSGISAGTA